MPRSSAPKRTTDVRALPAVQWLHFTKGENSVLVSSGTSRLCFGASTAPCLRAKRTTEFSKAFNPTAKMPDVSDRLFRFWKYPVEIEPQVFGAKGLLDEGLFPYPTYRMLGGMPFQKIEVQ